MARGSNTSTSFDVPSRAAADAEPGFQGKSQICTETLRSSVEPGSSVDDILYGTVAASNRSSSESRLQAAIDDVTAALDEGDWSEAISVLEGARDELEFDPPRLQQAMGLLAARLPFDLDHDLSQKFYAPAGRKLDQALATEELLRAFAEGDDLGELRLGIPLTFLEREQAGVLGSELAQRVIDFPERVESFPTLSMMVRDQAIDILDEAHDHGQAWKRAFRGLAGNILDHHCERDYYRSPAQGLHQVLNGDDLHVRWFHKSRVLHLFGAKDSPGSKILSGHTSLCGTTIKDDTYSQHDWKYANKGDWKRIADGDNSEELDGFRICEKCARLGKDHPSAVTDPDPYLYNPTSHLVMRSQAIDRAREYLDSENDPDYDGFEESLTDFEESVTRQLATERLIQSLAADPDKAWEQLLGRKIFELEAPLPQMSPEQAGELLDNINGSYIDRKRYRQRSRGKAFETCKQLQVEQGLREPDPVEEPTVNNWSRWTRGIKADTHKPTDEAHLFLPNLPEASTSTVFTASPACGADLYMPERGQVRKRATHHCPGCEARKAAGQTRA